MERVLRVRPSALLLTIMSKKALLVIMDGFGMTQDPAVSAIAQANTPNLDDLMVTYPTTTLKTSGVDVGLMAGQMGDSNVGHLNIGAGRIIWQMLPRIMQSIADESFYTEPVLINAVQKARVNSETLHIMGLVSDGGVHSHIIEIKALLELVKRQGPVPVAIHAFLDGRDVPPQSAKQYIGQVEQWCAEYPFAHLATVSGRFYAMDRDQRWARTDLAVQALMRGQGVEANSGLEALDASYAKAINDEFVLPTVIKAQNRPVAMMAPGETVIYINFRADRARQLSAKLLEQGVTVIGMAQYDAALQMPVVFPPQPIHDTLGEVISKAGLKQVRAAETEKYAHVTFFFNGGREVSWPGEDRILVPSPQIATYDLQPEMSATEVTARLLDKLACDKPALTVVNFANCDMVGHTGIMTAAIKAVETVDRCVGEIVNTLDLNEYAIVITADHGNAEQMGTPEKPYTAHTLNEVPCIIVDSDVVSLHKGGRLADIAPTLLDLMGIPQPEAMTGRSLINKRKR